MDDDLFNNILKTESVFKNQKSLNQAWVPDKDEIQNCFEFGREFAKKTQKRTTDITKYIEEKI